VSKPKNRRNMARGAKRRSAGGDYHVGYCQPPKHTRFKAGQSGNPKGRPKGAKNEATIWRDIFARKVPIRDRGQVRKVSLLEAMLLKYTERALNGEAKAADFVLNRYGRSESTAPETAELDQDDRALLESYARGLETKLKRKKQ
jgi:hypothetical protein